MLAYVNLIQKKEKEIGCDVLTHQKWYDRVLETFFHFHSHVVTLAGVAPTTSIGFCNRCQLARRAHRLLGMIPLSIVSDTCESMFWKGHISRKYARYSNTMPRVRHVHVKIARDMKDREISEVDEIGVKHLEGHEGPATCLALVPSRPQLK